MSLAIAVAAGMAAAAALGAAVSPYARDAGPVYVEGPSLSIVADRLDYAAGEEVRISLVNTGSVTVEFAGGSHYGLEVSRLDGAPVHTPPPRDTDGPLGPRDSVEFAWAQDRPDGTPAHPGTYRIVAEGTAGGEDARASITVNIHG